MTLPEQAGQILGSYALERFLGEGATGRVWLVRHVKLGKRAAIKILKSEHAQNRELLGRFFDEARAVSQMNHPHIVSVTDFVEEHEPPRVYTVMEYLEGESLGQKLAHGSLPLSATLEVMRQVCDALGAAHRLGVVHRDVKPDNILVGERDGQPFAKVLDFGTAKLSPALRREAVTTTQSGAVVGTPRYMPPEQIVGLDVDASADVYSAATVLYELLAGQPPFAFTDFGRLSLAVIKEPAPPLPSKTAAGERIPPPVARAVMAALAKEPRERPPIEALGAALVPGAARSSSPRWPLLVGALLLGVAVAGSLWTRSQPVAPVAPAPPAKVKLTVTSQPPGASVTRLDTLAVLGTTPLLVDLPRGAAPFPLRIALLGHEPLTRDALPASDLAIDVMLTPSPTTVLDAGVRAPDAGHGAKKTKRLEISNEGTLDPFGP